MPVRVRRIIPLMIIIGFVLSMMIFIFGVYKMGYNVAERRERQIDNRDKIIERIDALATMNMRIPDSLVEAGFELLEGSYRYKGMIFDYTRLPDNDYMVEYFSEDGAIMQFTKSENRWKETP